MSIQVADFLRVAKEALVQRGWANNGNSENGTLCTIQATAEARQRTIHAVGFVAASILMNRADEALLRIVEPGPFIYLIGMPTASLKALTIYNDYPERKFEEILMVFDKAIEDEEANVEAV